MVIAPRSAQDLVLDFVRSAGTWNNFSGPRIADDLYQHRDTWRAAYLTVQCQEFLPELRPYGLEHKVNLLPLRQLGEGHLTPDTLFVLPTCNHHQKLETLARAWMPDELQWLDFDTISRAMMVNRRSHADLFPDEVRAVLRLWWD
jgi:hypothetical protein